MTCEIQLRCLPFLLIIFEIFLHLAWSEIQYIGHDSERHTPVHIRSHSRQCISEQKKVFNSLSLRFYSLTYNHKFKNVTLQNHIVGNWQSADVQWKDPVSVFEWRWRWHHCTFMHRHYDDQLQIPPTLTGYYLQWNYPKWWVNVLHSQYKLYLQPHMATIYKLSSL